MKFINIKCFNLNSNNWNSTKKCYEVSVDLFEKHISVHSLRVDEITDIEHHAYELMVIDGNWHTTTLKYYNIKVHTPTGRGINGISTNIRVTEASYKRICNEFGINAECQD